MGKLLLLFVVVPLLEAFLLAKLGAWMGWANTVALVIVTGVVGAWLFRLEGTRAWAAWQKALASGRQPEEGVLGGLLLLLGGAFLITPGVLTDAVGLLLLLPFTRHRLAALLKPRLMDRFFGGGRGEGGEATSVSSSGGGVRVIHFGNIGGRPFGGGPFGGGPIGGGPLGGDSDWQQVDADTEPVVVGRRIPMREAAPAPKVIDADFEVLDED